jgi:hypothetical protein
MLQVFRKARFQFFKIWPIVSIVIILTISSNALITISSFSQSNSSKNAQVQRSKELPAIIYQALAEDIVQIFKWMENTDITPAELAMNILGYKTDDTDIILPLDASHPGLPSFEDSKYLIHRKNIDFNKYLIGTYIHISALDNYQVKPVIWSVWIKPLEFKGTEKTWYDNFSAIKFMDYLSKGTERPKRMTTGDRSDLGLYQTINLKQKYFKLSRLNKYVVSIKSSPTGAWRLPNREHFSREKYPSIMLEIRSVERSSEFRHTKPLGNERAIQTVAHQSNVHN